MDLCVSIETLQSNNDVCERKIAMQKIMSQEKVVNISKWAAFAQNINQQIGNINVPDSVIGFNAS
jgi:hypothetical protein